ncbi:MAG: hypothetical protein A4E19_05445 [Nitrospira sp. SG-bin1]|nr:MAG: hypothetical protein A4E19_05445 [Nitrospira sp. SG-bin1]
MTGAARVAGASYDPKWFGRPEERDEFQPAEETADMCRDIDRGDDDSMLCRQASSIRGVSYR